MGAPREGTQPSRPGSRGRPQPDPRRRRRLHRARRPGQRPDGRHRQGRRGVLRAWCTTTSPPRSSSSPRCSATPARSPTPSPSRPWSGPAPSRCSGSRPSSTAACPATSCSPTTGGSGRSSTCSACGSRRWPRSAPTSTRPSTPASPSIITAGIEAGVFDLDTQEARLGGRDRRGALRRPRRTRRGSRPGPVLGRGTQHGRRRRRAAGRPRRPPARAPTRRCRRPVHEPDAALSHAGPSSRAAWRWARRPGLATSGCAYIPSETPVQRDAAEVGEGQDRRRPRLLQLGRLPRPQHLQGLPEGVRRQDHPVELRLDGGHVRQDPGRQPVRHHLPDRQVGARSCASRASSVRSTTASSATPTRSSTPAPTSTTPGTTTSRPSRCRSPSTRPASAGAPTRSTR